MGGDRGVPSERILAVESMRAHRVPYTVNEATLHALGRWAVTLLNVMGVGVLGELGRFSRSAGPGAMITIKRTRDGFTAQVTGAIVGGGAEPLSVDAIQMLTVEIDGNGALLNE